jgi:hypothetical protein
MHNMSQNPNVSQPTMDGLRHQGGANDEYALSDNKDTTRRTQMKKVD